MSQGPACLLHFLGFMTEQFSKLCKLFLEGEWKCMYSEDMVDGEAAAEVQRFTPALSVRF